MMKIFETQKRAKQIIELDKKLVTALFNKAIATETDYLQKDTDISYSDMRMLLNDIFDTSEALMQVNPILSSALWGIWDIAKHHQLALFPKRKKSFIQYRGSVCTAIIQFADGNAETVSTFNAHSDTGYEKYQKNAMEALKLIEKETVQNSVSA